MARLALASCIAADSRNHAAVVAISTAPAMFSFDSGGSPRGPPPDFPCGSVESARDGRDPVQADGRSR